ncbi:MAG: tripartite tricarboxylate transporter substrate binding protein [Pseudomonadota bacterium]
MNLPTPRGRALKRLLCLTLLACAGATATSVMAAYPDKPIKLIIPFSPGGTVDNVARMVATELGSKLGTTVVVENVPGAGGSIAAQRVVKSAADGYTLLFTTPNHTINPALNPKLPFDTAKDLVAVSLVAEIPELLVAHSAQPYSDFAGFVKYARENPGKLNHGSAGNGTLPHITMELLLLRLDLKVTHIPYKGAAPAMNDLLAGQVSVKMDTIATSAGHIKTGRLKPLAIASLKRSPLMPQVPTIAESGLPGYEGILWMGLLAPAGTPADVVQALHGAITRTLKEQELLKRFESDGVVAVGSSPAEFDRLINTELKQWADVVKRAQIKAD